jgi:hypothetical protein
MLAIPATQEAEIGRMAVLGQLRRKKKKKFERLPVTTENVGRGGAVIPATAGNVK